LLKIVIALLLLALIASLASGFYFLMVDQGDNTKRRTLHSLGVRVSITVALIAIVIYGVATGQLGHGTPWEAGPKRPQSSQE